MILGLAPPIGLAIGVAWVIALGGIGALVTELGPWYYGLRKPSWQPPDFLFGPVWTTIFLLAAWAGLLAWYGPRATPESRTWLVWAYFANSACNVLWSALFFRMRRPDWALVEVAFLLLSIVAMMVAVGKASSVAVWMLVPYLAWVSFATVLNRAIIRLNGPFNAR